MALNALGMGLIFSAKDLASGTIMKLNRRMGALNKQTGIMARIGKGAMATMKIGVAGLVGGIAGLLVVNRVGRAFDEFEQSMARVGAIAQATPSELRELTAAAKQAGIATQFSPKAAADGLAALAAQGFNAKEQIALLNPALDLAAAGQISVAQAATVTAASMKTFGDAAKNPKLAVDQLLKISNRTALAAGDLQIALANVSAGAVAAGQDLSEMLPTLGLIKNTGLDASVAGTSAASAMSFMAKNAKKFKGVGVDVTDASGKFRPFLDIVLDSSAALDKKFPNAATKAAKANQMFGRFGAKAFQSIQKALKDGVKDTQGNLLKGAEAVDFLRKSMKGAAGTAEVFKDKLLDTVKGQKQLLKGSLETLAIAVGEPLSKALRPLVTGFVKTVNKVIGAIEKMSPRTKALFGRIMVGASAFAAIGGAVAIFVGGVILALPAIKAVAGAIGSMVSGMWPFLIVVGVAASAIASLKVAVDQNIGGLGDKFRDTFSSITLLVKGAMQLFSDGGFSGAVAGDLSKAENSGLLNFLLKLQSFAESVQGFFKGTFAGIEAAVQAASPVFVQFSGALDELAQAFGFLGEAGEAPADAFDSGAKAGASFGQVLGTIGALVTGVLTAAIDVVTGFANSWGSVSGAVGGLFSAFGDIGAVFGDMIAVFTDAVGAANNGGSVFQFVGGLLAGVFTTAVRVATMAIRVAAVVIRFLGRTFVNLASVIRGIMNVLTGFLVEDWTTMWAGMKQITIGAVRILVDIVTGLAAIIARIVDGIASLFGADAGLSRGLDAFKDNLLSVQDTQASMAGGGFTPLVEPGGFTPIASGGAASAQTFTPAAAAGGFSVDPSAIASSAAGAAAAAAASVPPVVVAGDVTLDGEVIGRLNLSAERDGANTSGSPTGIVPIR